MNKLTRSDLSSTEEYLKGRDEHRKRMIALKKFRRVEVGERLSFSFENRETVKYQIQEMMRIEKIEDEKKIQFEIDIYNDLLPEPGSLSATMFIEIPETYLIKPLLDEMQGIDRPGTIVLRIDGEPCAAEFEQGHSKENRISAVHYVKFPLTENQRKRFRNAQVELVVQHASYNGKTVLSAGQKEEIARDLE